MLFAASFGEAIQDPFQWQTLIGFGAALLLRLLKNRFPAAAWLWDLITSGLDKLLPPVKPAPAPVPPPQGKPLDDLSFADIVALLKRLISKIKNQEIEGKAAMEAIKAELAK